MRLEISMWSPTKRTMFLLLLSYPYAVAKDVRVPVRWKIYSIIPYRTSHLNFTPRYLVRRTQVVIMGEKCGVRPILSTNIKKNRTKRLFCFAFGKNLLHLCNETPSEFLLRIFWCVFFIYFLSVSCAWRRLCRRHPLACRWSLSVCNFCETFSFLEIAVKNWSSALTTLW